MNNGNTRGMREICSKLKLKTTQQRYRCRSVFFFVNFEQISYKIVNMNLAHDNVVCTSIPRHLSKTYRKVSASISHFVPSDLM